METHVLDFRRGHRSFHDHPPRGAIEGAPLHNGGLPDREPLSFLEVGHNPLAVHQLQNEATAGTEHRRGGTDHLPVVRFIGEVAQAREQVEDDLERLAGNRPAHVCRQPSDSDAPCPPAFLRHAE